MAMKPSKRPIGAGEHPAWFRRNVGVPAVSRFVSVNGASIHYRQWGEANGEKPGILFVHGGYAHSHWWDFIAPEFLDDYRVVAMDSSGSGESDRREVYAAGVAAAEVTAGCRDAGFGDDAFLVGHSLGFMLAMLAAMVSPGHYRGLIGIDPPGEPEPRSNHEPGQRRQRVFSTRSEALEAFRLRYPLGVRSGTRPIRITSAFRIQRNFRWFRAL